MHALIPRKMRHAARAGRMVKTEHPFDESMVQHGEYRLLVCTQVFAPEARRTLAGGGAPRNHRTRRTRGSCALEGRRTRIGFAAQPGPASLPGRNIVLNDSGGSAALHHRLISIVPPGRMRHLLICG